MKLEQLSQEIREANLSYLLLAQQMLREDRAQAMYRLGVSEEVADMIESLTMAQLLKLAAQNMLMCRFRFDDEMVWGLLSSHSQDGALPKAMHASILMSRQPVAA